MLGAHSAIDSGPETFFFARLPAETGRLLDPTDWPGPAADYVSSLRLGEQPIHELYGRTRADVVESLADASPSLSAMLESLTATHAASVGKARWAEKTPGHLARIPLIRTTFPDAAIVRVVRDPRDAALSMTKVPFASDSLLVNLYACARKDRVAQPKVQRDRRLLTVRYEELVLDTDTQLRRICEFIGETFEPAMAVGGRSGDGVAAAHEWWKQKAGEAPDASRVEAWRREMSEIDQRAAAVICSEMIARHGYPDGLPIARTVVIEPEGEAFVRRHEDVAREMALHGVVVRRGRAGRASGAEVVFWPRDGVDPWRFGRRRRGQARRLARMSWLLARRRIGRRPTLVVMPDASADAARSRGLATRSAGVLLRLFARRMRASDWLASLR